MEVDCINKEEFEVTQTDEKFVIAQKTISECEPESLQNIHREIKNKLDLIKRQIEDLPRQKELMEKDIELLEGRLEKIEPYLVEIARLIEKKKREPKVA